MYKFLYLRYKLRRKSFIFIQNINFFVIYIKFAQPEQNFIFIIQNFILNDIFICIQCTNNGPVKFLYQGYKFFFACKKPIGLQVERTLDRRFTLMYTRPSTHSAILFNELGSLLLDTLWHFRPYYNTFWSFNIRPNFTDP